MANLAKGHYVPISEIPGPWYPLGIFGVEQTPKSQFSLFGPSLRCRADNWQVPSEKASPTSAATPCATPGETVFLPAALRLQRGSCLPSLQNCWLLRVGHCVNSALPSLGFGENGGTRPVQKDIRGIARRGFWMFVGFAAWCCCMLLAGQCLSSQSSFHCFDVRGCRGRHSLVVARASGRRRSRRFPAGKVQARVLCTGCQDAQSALLALAATRELPYAGPLTAGLAPL